MTFRALYDGVCEDCGGLITPGQVVHHLGVGQLVHNRCPSTVACPRCWTLRATNGRCNCEEDY